MFPWAEKMTLRKCGEGDLKYCFWGNDLYFPVVVPGEAMLSCGGAVHFGG